jgi:hypothetical protein
MTTKSSTVLAAALADLLHIATDEVLVREWDAELLAEPDYHALRDAVRATGATLERDDDGALVVRAA